MILFESLSAEVQAAFQEQRNELPSFLFLGPNAATELADALRKDTKGCRVAVLFDQRTRQVAGPRCLDALKGSGWETFPMLVPDTEGRTPTCDDHTKARLSAQLPVVDALVAVGSGVINDLTKWLAADANLPYAAYATACSMNGYASANVAPKVNGVKSLVQGRAARVVAADPAVLCAAPHRLTASGFGDLLAKPVSTADWILNHEVFGESFSPSLVRLTERFDAMVLAHPDALGKDDPAAIESLFEALVLSGCAMTLHGSSLPASGGEHVISHTLDMMSEADGIEHDLHGRQVGVATVLSAALWEEMMQLETPRFEPVLPLFDPSVWGPAADAVAQQRSAKKLAIEAACEKLSSPGAWDALRARVSPHLLSPAVLRARLCSARAAWRLEDIGCSRDRFLVALRHASAMRARFTSIDLAHITGLLPQQGEALVDAWLT